MYGDDIVYKFYKQSLLVNGCGSVDFLTVFSVVASDCLILVGGFLILTQVFSAYLIHMDLLMAMIYFSHRVI